MDFYRRAVALLGAFVVTVAIFGGLASRVYGQSAAGVPFVSAATTNCTLIPNSANRSLIGMTMGNTNTAAWIKFYDMNTVPVAGATQGSQQNGNPYIFPIPGNAALAGSNVTLPQPIPFLNGVAYCATGGAANNDTTPLSVNQVAGTIFLR